MSTLLTVAFTSKIIDRELHFGGVGSAKATLDNVLVVQNLDQGQYKAS